MCNQKRGEGIIKTGYKLTILVLAVFALAMVQYLQYNHPQYDIYCAK